MRLELRVNRDFVGDRFFTDEVDYQMVVRVSRQACWNLVLCQFLFFCLGKGVRQVH